MPELHNNQKQNRFEIEVNGELVFANYRHEGKKLYIDHVESPVSLRGTGAAGTLMQGIKDYVEAQKLEVIPICSYASVWLKRHA